MNTKNYILALIALLIVFASCKKDEVGDTVFYNNGSVTGTIQGKKKDNSSFNEKFSYEKYLPLLNKQFFTVDPSTQKCEFDIEFMNEDKSLFELDFSLSSVSDNTPEDIYFQLTYYKAESDKVFHFHAGNVNNNYSFSNFYFDRSTGTLKCKVIVTGDNNSTDQNAVIEATVDVKLKEIVE